MTTHHHRSIAGLRERVAAGLLRTATDLARQRTALFARIAAQPPCAGRDRALGDLALGAWTESALLWLGWRLMPADALADRCSAPGR